MTATVDEHRGDKTGIFYIDEDFMETFNYNSHQSTHNKHIDMEKLDYRETAKDYHFFKKKFPLFDDSIIEMLVELEIQQDRKQKVIDTVKNTIASSHKKAPKPSRKQKIDQKLKIYNKSCVVTFD